MLLSNGSGPGRRSAVVAVALCLATWACTQDAPVSPDASPLFDATGKMATSDQVNLMSFIDGTKVGTSTLTRTSQNVSVVLQHDNAPAHAFTVWGVVFNNPDECAGSPCGLADLFDPDVNGSVARAGGQVVGAEGAATFSGQLREGDDSEALFGPGLVDAMVAEIHFILRSHGPPQADEGEVDDQISSVDGGCEIELGPGMPTAEGECGDIAFSIHLP